jgi:hypothetical protein
MRRLLAWLIVGIAVSPAARAGEVELTGSIGYTFPFYGQTFTYDPGPVSVPIPGVTIEQRGVFELKATGGLAFGAGLTFYPTGGLGLELRYDTADIAVETRSAGYTVRAELPPPLPPFVADLTFARGEADLKALSPLSFNLKLRSGGGLRLYTSGGASRLGDIEFSLEQTAGLGVILVDIIESELDVGTIVLRGRATGESGSSWGGNLGLGFQIGLGDRGAIVVEGRGFYFPKRTFEWELADDRPLTPVEQELLERVLGRLEPIEFEPWWVQASIGVAIRF